MQRVGLLEEAAEGIERGDQVDRSLLGVALRRTAEHDLDIEAGQRARAFVVSISLPVVAP
jgi:hypothetical protein